MSRLFLVGVVFAVFLGSAHGQSEINRSERTYAVLSLIGDVLHVVTYQPRTGTSRDPNRRESIALADAHFDKVALMATDTALRKQDPKTMTILLASRSPELFRDQEALFAGSRVSLPSDIADAVKKSGATHLVLLTKYRGEARLQAAQGSLGSGKLQGLGFYVDGHYRLSRSDTGEVGWGFLAPFAYIRLSLVNATNFEVVSEEITTATQTLSSARNKEGSDPWGILTPDQKVQTLSNMITRELSGAVPALISKAQ